MHPAFGQGERAVARPVYASHGARLPAAAAMVRGRASLRKRVRDVSRPAHQRRGGVANGDATSLNRAFIKMELFCLSARSARPRWAEAFAFAGERLRRERSTALARAHRAGWR